MNSRKYFLVLCLLLVVIELNICLGTIIVVLDRNTIIKKTKPINCKYKLIELSLLCMT